MVNTGDNLAHLDALPPLLDALGPLLDVPGCLRARLQRLLRADRCATRCATCCPTTASATRTPRSCPGARCRDAFSAAGWIDLTNRRTSTTVRRPDVRVGGRRRPAPGLRRPGRGGGPGRRRRRRPRSRSRTRRTSGCSTSSPATGTTRSSPGTPTAARSALPVLRRAGHQLRPRAGPRQGAAPPPGRLASGRPGVVLAARLGRPRHLAVLPDPDGLPPRGDPADADLARLITASRRGARPGFGAP